MNHDNNARFAEYVRRGLRFALRRGEATPGVLTEELREQALALLDLSLPVATVWPQARELLLAIAPKMEQAGFRDEWFPFLEAGLRQSERQQDRLTAAEVQLQLGLLHRLRSNFDESERWLTLALAGFADENEQQGQARTLNQLAYLAWQTHRHAQATQRANEALLLLTANDLERAMSLSALGLVAIDKAEWERAEELHRAALAIRTSYGDQRRMAWSLQNLGYALRGQGKYGEAIVCYEQASALLEAVYDPAHAAVVQMNMGIAYYLNGQAHEAIEIYRLVESVFRKMHDQQNLAHLYNNLGLAYRILQDWANAEQIFLASIVLYNEVGDTSFRLEALDELRLVYLAQDKHEPANWALEAILADLPTIQGTPSHSYLVQSIAAHVEQ